MRLLLDESVLPSWAIILIRSEATASASLLADV